MLNQHIINTNVKAWTARYTRDGVPPEAIAQVTSSYARGAMSSMEAVDALRALRGQHGPMAQASRQPARAQPSPSRSTEAEPLPRWLAQSFSAPANANGWKASRTIDAKAIFARRAEAMQTGKPTPAPVADSRAGRIFEQRRQAVAAGGERMAADRAAARGERGPAESASAAAATLRRSSAEAIFARRQAAVDAAARDRS
ncbi:hypothetical protein [Faunimonas pinastri]|nr:hypothetical protein [Faunimonas pinastri]